MKIIYPWKLPKRSYKIIFGTPVGDDLREYKISNAWMGMGLGPNDASIEGSEWPVGSREGEIIYYRLYPAIGRYDEGSTKCGAKNLVIIVDGIDLKNNRQVDNIVQDFNIPMTTLSEKGYDILILDYRDGRDYIQRNANVLMEIFKKIPGFMMDGYKDNDAIVLSASMGGQVTRYALAKMEEQNLDHHVGLWAALDSPFLGANLPWGMQGFFRFMAPESNELKALVGGLNSPAARQLLRRYTNIIPDPEHKNFYSEANALNNGIGLPSKPRILSVASGSGYGESAYGVQDGVWPRQGSIYNFLSANEKVHNYLNSETYGIDVSSNTEYNFSGNFNYASFNGWINKPATRLGTGNGLYQKWFWLLTGASNIDVSPGGYFESPLKAVVGYNKVVDKSSDRPNKYMTSELGLANFIPTFSSLYNKQANNIGTESVKLQRWEDCYIVGGGSCNPLPATTFTQPSLLPKADIWWKPVNDYEDIRIKVPFDDIWYEKKNTEHVITPGLNVPEGREAFLFNEMDSFSSQEDFSNRLMYNPKIAMNEILLVGNLTGCGNELMTINTFTRKAMVQKYDPINGNWTKIWDSVDDNPGYIGVWKIGKGDKNYLPRLNLLPENAELFSVSADLPARAVIQKLHRTSGSKCASDAVYEWQTAWTNNGNGYITEEWEIQPTDKFIFGDAIPVLLDYDYTKRDELLIVHAGMANNEDQGDDPSMAYFSTKSELLWFYDGDWGTAWANWAEGLGFSYGPFHHPFLIGNWPIHYGDYYEFVKINNTMAENESLLSVNMLRNLFDAKYLHYDVRCQNFLPRVIIQTFNPKIRRDQSNLSIWDCAYTNYGQRPDLRNPFMFGSWDLKGYYLGLMDSFHAFDMEGNGIDEILTVNPIDLYIQKYNGTHFELMYSNNGLGNFGPYQMQEGDRFFFGDIDNNGQEDVIAINPVTEGQIMILTHVNREEAFDAIYTDNTKHIGNWELYKR